MIEKVEKLTFLFRSLKYAIMLCERNVSLAIILFNRYALSIAMKSIFKNMLSFMLDLREWTYNLTFHELLCVINSDT